VGSHAVATGHSEGCTNHSRNASSSTRQWCKEVALGSAWKTPVTTMETNERDGTYRNGLATMVLLGFLLVCVGTFWLIYSAPELESWAAGTLGAVLGYWANNFTQTVSYFFGSSQSNAANRNTVDKMIAVQAEAAKVLAAKVPSPPKPEATPAKVEVVNPEPVEVSIVPPPGQEI
jgi:hypothetical protein